MSGRTYTEGAYVASPVTLLSTELNNLAIGGNAISGGVFANNAGYLYGDLEIDTGSSFAPTESGCVLVWFLRSIDGGQTFEDGGTTVTPARGPDVTIPIGGTAMAARVAGSAESPEGTTVTGPAGVIYASPTQGAPAAKAGPFTTFQLSATGQVLRNGAADASISNAAVLYYHNHTTYVMASMAAESSQDTALTSTSGSIIDASLNIWTLQNSANGLVIYEGPVLTPSGNVNLLLYHNHAVYQRNTAGGWWVWQNGIWVGSSDPRVAPPPPPSSGFYSIAGGVLLGPNGVPFKAKGIGMTDQSMVPASQVIARFPGLNLVNFSLGAEGGGYSTAISYSAIYAWVDDAISKGLIVILSDYVPGQPAPRTGGDLTNSCNWYATLARYYAGQGNVWFTTENEVAGLTTESMQAIYAAIRGAGNPSLLFLESAWGAADHTYDTDPAVANNMTGVGWNIHAYPGAIGGATNQASADSYQSGLISMWQAYGHSLDGTMPVLMGEGGPSSSGSGIDDYWDGSKYLNVRSIDNLTTNGPGGYCGYAMWVWSFNNGGYNGGDALINAGTSGSTNTLTTYGQQAAAQLAAHPGG